MDRNYGIVIDSLIEKFDEMEERYNEEVKRREEVQKELNDLANEYEVCQEEWDGRKRELQAELREVKEKSEQRSDWLQNVKRKFRDYGYNAEDEVNNSSHFPHKFPQYIEKICDENAELRKQIRLIFETILRDSPEVFAFFQTDANSQVRNLLSVLSEIKEKHKEDEDAS